MEKSAMKEYFIQHMKNFIIYLEEQDEELFTPEFIMEGIQRAVDMTPVPETQILQELDSTIHKELDTDV